MHYSYKHEMNLKVILALHNHGKIVRLKIFDAYLPSLARRVCCWRTSRDTQRWPQESTVRRMTMIWNTTWFLPFGFLKTLYLSLVSSEWEKTVRKKRLKLRKNVTSLSHQKLKNEEHPLLSSPFIFEGKREERYKNSELWEDLFLSLISDTLSVRGNDTNRLDRESQ